MKGVFEMKKEDKVFSISIVGVLFILMILIVGGELVWKLFGIDLGKESNNSKEIQINWEEEYPFKIENLVEGESEAVVLSENKTLIEKYCNTMDKFENIGRMWSPKIWKYFVISKAGYVMNAAFSDPGIGGYYTRLKNGYWTTLESSKCNDIETEQKTENIADLMHYVNKNNIPFLYIQPPIKLCKQDDELPVSTEDYSNINIDLFLAGLKNKGVKYLDLRENLHQDFDSHYSLFYKTDHHWNVHAGLWAANIIEQQIKNEFCISLDTEFNNIELYKEKKYKNAMFGSSGHAITHFIEKSEDFSILFPKFNTNYRIIIPDKEIDKNGTFEEVFIDYDNLKKSIQAEGGFVYETLVYGNRPLVKIINKNNINGPKILMIRDSFSLAVAPYLSMSCSELDLIDTRQTNGNFTGSVRTYIEKNKPDIVLMLLSYPGEAYK